MTLTKAIEAAREALKFTLECVGDAYNEQSYNSSVKEECNKALAVLPDKPMTEDAALKIVLKCLNYPEDLNRAAREDALKVIRAFKSHNVLFVSEEK